MRYCITHKDALTDKQADEIIIKLKPNSDFASMLKYIQDNIKEKRIIFYLIEDWTIEEFNNFAPICKTCKDEGLNIAVCLELFPTTFPIMYALRDADIPYFFNAICNTKMQLLRMFQLNTSDIYVGGELGFSLDKVKSINQKRKVTIRVIPNHPINSLIEGLVDPIKTFWILPNFIDEYEDCIDVLELDSKAALDVYKSKNWDGRIKDIIHDIPCEVFSNTIPPVFNNCRKGCGLQCAYNNCNICEGALRFAEELSKRDLEITQDDRTREDN